jgi:hypothetical protein
MTEAVIEFEEVGGVGDTLTVDERDGHFNFTTDEPWAGDSETGFGQSGSVSLTLSQALELWDWLGGRLKSHLAKPSTES